MGLGLRFGLGVGSPSWYSFRVPTSVHIEIIGRGVGCRAPPPTVFFGRAISPAHRSKIDNVFCTPVSLSTLVIGSSLKIFDERASFWRNFDFFAFLGFLGVRALAFLSGTAKQAKNPKNRVWGPVEAVSAKFSGDLKVAHGDSATDEPKKSRF